jgi:hypothetical protein
MVVTVPRFRGTASRVRSPRGARTKRRHCDVASCLIEEHELRGILLRLPLGEVRAGRDDRRLVNFDGAKDFFLA